MDDSSQYGIVSLAVLALLHILIVLVRESVVHSRASLLRERMGDADESVKRILNLVDNPEPLEISADLLLTLLKLLMAALVHVVLPPVSSGSGSPWALILLLGLVLYVAGQYLPAVFGRLYADRLVLHLGIGARLITLLLSPIVFPLRRVESALADARSNAIDTKSAFEEEIKDLFESGEREGTIEEDEREMLRSVLEFDETLVREIMVPRPDITAIEIDEPLREALRLFIESGHSRIPVYEGEIDHIQGVLYAKDLLETWYKGEQDQRSIRELMRKVYFVPETKRADELFRELQRSNVHLAIVVDEYGSTAGVITVEDIIEEIVGDIRDEFDATEIVEFLQVGEDEYSVDAAINLYDFNQLLDVELPEEGADSLGGYLYTQFGRVPEVGERLVTHGLLMRIESVEGVRIRRVHVSRVPETTHANGTEAEKTAKAAAPPQLDPRPSEI